MRQILVLAALLFGATVHAAPPVIDPAKVMVLEGPITSQSIAPLKQVLLNEIVTDTVRPELQLIINSPGGSVTAGFQFVAVLKAAKDKGMHVTCIVPGIAASMAFQILLQCDERHVLREAFLLWHRARVMGIDQPMTGPMLTHLGWELESTDATILADLLATLGMRKGEVLFHFEHETLHVGRALCSTTASTFCTSYDTIPGVYEAYSNPKVVRSAREMNPFLFKKNELIYISPRFMP